MRQFFAGFVAWALLVQSAAIGQQPAQPPKPEAAAQPTPAPAQTASPPPPAMVSTGNLNLANASLTEVDNAIASSMNRKVTANLCAVSWAFCHSDLSDNNLASFNFLATIKLNA